MTTDLDELLADSLQRRAGGADVDPAALLNSAVERGRRIRRRRRVVVAGSAFVATAAVVVGLAVAAGMPRPPAPAQSAGPAPAPSVVPSTAEPHHGALWMPPAADQPGALSRPDLVGSDTSVLHFSINGMTEGAESARWASSKDFENAEFFNAAGTKSFAVNVARSSDDFGKPSTVGDAQAVTVNGRPATIAAMTHAGTWIVTWQPADGFWAQAFSSGYDRADALRLAGSIRFDQATRCVVPFRLTAMPPGLAVQQCTVSLSNSGPHPGLQDAFLQVGDGRRYADMSAYNGQDASKAFRGDVTVGRYRVLRQGGTWVFLAKPYFGNLSTEVGGHGPIPESAARALIAGFRPVGTPDDPLSW
ncbi:MAG TPA: hypothetical protein VH502_07575 [Actinoplanes sp.]|jgi:hypothetical protein